jgi:ABC-type sugar transport system permease subunit
LGVIASAIWKGTPFSTVMYLAALQGVSEDLIDAAKIDGATGWKRLLYVIIPSIAPVIRITVLLTTVWTANYFDIIFVMTGGGPLNQTHIFPTYLYELALYRGKTSMAAAFGLVTAMLLLVFSLWYVRELNKRKALD